ncbi:hypothetical protein [Paraburkholderia solisilvae]|uniref:Uncharacterized protein n=1 Tax=Paraburkholderia solisilvae TaxID=624376 RepID=A0A6J5F1W0_9BURK|nr:hypothetical protein [Paraburkholderia solisilvae]CAB3771681.1 hypothetical protein LMG29739_06090 [Paraburkholderia solisilvae]
MWLLVDTSAVLAMVRAMWLNCRRWHTVRSSYDEMLDELERIALTHLRMLDDGIDAPEALDRKFMEFAGRIDARIREAFQAVSETDS